MKHQETRTFLEKVKANEDGLRDELQAMLPDLKKYEKSVTVIEKPKKEIKRKKTWWPREKNKTRKREARLKKEEQYFPIKRNITKDRFFREKLKIASNNIEKIIKQMHNEQK